MTGGRSPDPIPKEDPPARIETVQEVDEAKKKVKKRARASRGRDSTRLAGRMMAEREANNLKKILG